MGRVVFISLAGTMFAASAVAQDIPLPNFKKHIVDGAFEKGYQVCVADIDSDGDPDIVALSTTPSQLVWYRNPPWERFSITTKTNRNIDAAPCDVDGDGDIDLALASEFDLGDSQHGGAVQWLACPDDPASNHEWPIYAIDAVPTSHRVRWADLTGDGKKELLNLPIIGIGAAAPEYVVGVQFKAYRIPADPTEDPWEAIVVDDALAMAHGIAVVHWNDDAIADLLTASFGGVHLFQWQEVAFVKRHLGIGHQAPRPTQGSSEVGLGRLGSEQRPFLATIEPWHGHEVVVYTTDTPDELRWSRSVIDDSFHDGHGLVCVDLNDDGSDEIIAGYRGTGQSLYIYQYLPSAKTWERTPLDAGGIAVAGLAMADLNQDGRPDVVAIGTATNNVVWYENLGVAE